MCVFPHNISVIIAYLDKNDNLCYNGSIIVILLGKTMSVRKNFVILLLSSFIGIIANPEILTASDTVAINDVDRSVEVVIESEPSRAASISPVATGEIALNLALPRSESPSKATPQSPTNSISIAGRTIEVVNVANTKEDAGNHVNKYGEKFLYAHNAASTFGVLNNLGEGSVFSVTTNGVTKNYQVRAKVIYEKVAPTTLRLNGTDIEMSVVTRARYSGVATYDMALMTCYGTMYGNGDASHRLVLSLV